jgi:hypothetical protein
MMRGVLLLLLVFYAGAVFASARSWLAVWRGSAGFSALRDVTGIGDRTTLRRLFGLTSRDGRFSVSFAEVLRHRRPAGVVLTDLPVHLLFLSALGGAAALGAPALTAAVATTASAHALVLAIAAASVLARSRQPLVD